MTDAAYGIVLQYPCDFFLCVSSRHTAVVSAGMKGRTLVTARSFPVHTDVDLKDITNPVLIDLVQLRENLTALVGASNPRLQQVPLPPPKAPVVVFREIGATQATVPSLVL